MLGNVGDKVIVRFARNDVFEFQNGSMQIEAKVLYYPMSLGEHLIFEYKGKQFTLNPTTPDFIGLVEK